MKVRWGILGTAKIAQKNWRAIGYSGNSVVAAVASRERARAQKLIDDCSADVPMEQPPEAFGSYEDMLSSTNVDAVYVPLPTGLRKEWVIKAAEAGKHVLCEKPCATSMGELEEMVDACRRHKVQFMDGVMFMHHPRLPALRGQIEDGLTLGSFRRVTSSHTFSASADFLAQNIRIDGALEPHGCLGDLGWYCIRLSLWAMKWQLPLLATGRILSQRSRPGAKPVPTEFSGELVFEGGVSAGFHCSFLTAREQWAVFSGSKGTLQIPDIFIASGDDPKGSARTQESNMIRSFSEQVTSGTLSDFWPDIALKTQQVMMACYDSALANT